MLVTQRGWLYAIPAGLVLLWHWREKFFSQSPEAEAGSSAAAVARADDPGQSGESVKSEPDTVSARGYGKGPLPWWVELSIYASMPLFHLHTFIALTIVLVVGLFFERATEFDNLVNLVRKDGDGGHWPLDFASEDVARDFPRCAHSQTRCRPDDRGFHTGNFFLCG